MSGITDPLSQRAELETRVGSVIKSIYRLERLIGAGGMGAVYEASDRAGQRFAVKLVHPDLAQHGELLARFLREARIGETVNSNHVVPVIDGGRDEDGATYIVMPLLNGHDLAELLERVGPLPPDAAVRLMLQACDGLAAAHRTGVVHRDIKPSNLFLHYRPDGEVVLRVADFGVAKRWDMYDDSNLTRTGASLGSPLYMSPEQVLNAKTVDERTDIWSLAVTLYELLSGVTPYGDATTLGELLVRITTRNAPSIQAHAPWVGPDLALAIHQALHREPSGRFESILAFAGALRSTTLGDMRVHASELRPLGASERSRVGAKANVDSVSCPEGPVSGQPQSSGPEARLVGAVLDGRYRVIRLLGRGGMGNVYEAESREHGRVAVKVISSGAEGVEGTRRFLREAKASRAIDNPHVVKTLDAGTDPQTGLPFIVMELLRGVDLAVLLKRQGALLPAVMVRVLIQAARGVAAAHAQGVIHRDIKPANLFLSVTPGDPKVTVKVCDFGVAKRLFDETAEQATRDLTRTGGMLGSPMYMSPEQAQSAKTVDHRSDIWSLGISLYEGLSARRPWDDRTALGQIILAICTAPVAPLQDMAPWIEPGLAEVVHRALDKNPEQRLDSALALVRALEPFAGGTVDIARDDLRGVDLNVRARVAPRSTAIGTTTALGHSRSATDERGGGSRKTGVVTLALAGIVVLGIVGVAGYRLKTGSVRIEEVAPSLVAKPEPPKTAWLRVGPPGATVTLGGKPITTEQGRILLEGQPGESFAVVVSHEGRSRSATVGLMRDGTLNPPEVVVEPAPVAASAPPPVAPPRGRRTQAARTTGHAETEPAAPPAPTATTASKPAAPSPAKPAVVPVQDW